MEDFTSNYENAFYGSKYTHLCDKNKNILKKTKK